jgi:hypothetical protein
MVPSAPSFAVRALASQARSVAGEGEAVSTTPMPRKALRQPDHYALMCGQCGDWLTLNELEGHLNSEGRTLAHRPTSSGRFPELTSASVAFLLEHQQYRGCTMASLTIREHLEVIERQAAYHPSLDEALNSGDGIYRP